MNPLKEIKIWLEKYPDLEVVEDVNSISVKPIDNNGFEVRFSDDENEYTVGFEEDALSCFAFGLSEECRLKIFARGGEKYKWVVEALEDGRWVAYSTLI